MGRSRDFNTQMKAKIRWVKLSARLREGGISQREIASRIVENKYRETYLDPDKRDEFIDAECQKLSKYKNLDDDPKIWPKNVLSPDSARFICDAINKYPNDSDIHAGSDIRFEWLAGEGEDELSTYKEFNLKGYNEDLAEIEDLIRRQRDDAPQLMIDDAFEKRGFQLIANIDAGTGWISEYYAETVNGETIRLSPSEIASLREDLELYAKALISRVIESHSG